jgi:hypothetical protein
MLIERKNLFTGEIYHVDQDDIPSRFGISFNRLKELIECHPEEGWAKRKYNSNTGPGKAGDFLPCYTSLDNIFFMAASYNLGLSHTRDMGDKRLRS